MLVDTTGMTVTQLEGLVVELQQVIVQQRETEAQQATAQQQREAIAQAQGALDTLIGSPDQPPFNPDAKEGEPGHVASLHSLGAHGPEALAQHTGLVLDMLLEGALIQANVLRNVVGLVRAQLRDQ